MNNIEQEIEHVKNEWRILENQWKKTCQDWRDETKQQFENEFWRDFESLVPAYIRKLKETSDLISNANRKFDNF